MKYRLAAFVVFGVALLLAAPYQVVGQDNPQGELQFEGELLRMDVSAGTLTVRNDQAQEMTFHYNEQTSVTGDVDSVQGLSTQSQATVRVHYSTEGETSTASRIEVLESGN